MANRIIPCDLDGETAWCYVQSDGAHLDKSNCSCLTIPSERCPIDKHRLAYAGNDPNDMPDPRQE